THSEIYSLAKEFNQLKMFYQMNDDYELELKETLEKEESPLENIEFSNIEQQFDNQILTTLQIEKFQKIFAQHTIKEVCCNSKMCLNKIDHESAFQIFDIIRKLSKTEYNIFLLGMLHTMTRSNETLRGKGKQYLTVKYTFNNDEICEIAFRTVYSLLDKKWRNIHNNY
ncbi:1467_t:CDS:2, partial [Scutellospora calospora]